jgi:hypothetical protein
MQNAMQDGHILVRRNDIDVVRQNRSAILNLNDFHAGVALEQFRHDAFTRRIKVLDDDKCHAAVLGHMT